MFGLIGGFSIRNFPRKKQPIQETTRISAMVRQQYGNVVDGISVLLRRKLCMRERSGHFHLVFDIETGDIQKIKVNVL